MLLLFLLNNGSVRFRSIYFLFHFWKGCIWSFNSVNSSVYGIIEILSLMLFWCFRFGTVFVSTWNKLLYCFGVRFRRVYYTPSFIDAVLLLCAFGAYTQPNRNMGRRKKIMQGISISIHGITSHHIASHCHKLLSIWDISLNI